MLQMVNLCVVDLFLWIAFSINSHKLLFLFDFSGMKKRLFEIFDGWCDNVLDLLHATEEDAILRRDIYDRSPSFTWGKGRVTLLGDSIHAMQPNMGQGGCMAIEVSI